MEKPNRQLVPAPPKPAPVAPAVIDDGFIKSRIFTIRGEQMMLSSDLSQLYDVEVKHLHRQVKRNPSRFPSDFVLHLSPDDIKGLRCQNVTSNRGGDRYGLLAFTEQGVAMLSSVLKGERAAIVNVAIMRAFVAMRRTLLSLGSMMSRVEAMEHRQAEDEARQLTVQARNDANQARNEERFDTIFKAMDGGDFPPQKVFYDGQVYDAFEQMKKFVRMAKSELIVIDPYFDDSVLPLVAQKRSGVSVLVVRNSRNKQLHAADVAAFNAQYGNSLAVKISDRFHDRFLIIDRSVLIHVGASLNFLGKRCFAFSSLDKSNIPDILAKI